jgi:predicted cupin superfamily sugar epimerase
MILSMSDSIRSIEELVETLQLQAHPEGGFFRETWRSTLDLPASALPEHPGPRSAGTCIIYLLPAGEVSKPHRVRSDELWIFQSGDSLRLQMGTDAGDLQEHLLGPKPGEHFQALVPAHCWQSATPAAGDAGYSLVACVVVPGFDFEDFEMIDDAGHI